jgi:glucokinase
MRVLVGDVGGTKTVLALAEVAGDRVQVEHERRYPSGEAETLNQLVTHWLDDTGCRCDRAALAVAGPVMAGRCQTTNLPWQVDAVELAGSTDLGQVRLLNDLEAMAWGVAALEDDDVAVLQPGADDAAGNACVIAAGTGLGQAGLCWDGTSHRPFATEGGHTDFAATTATEQALLAYLQQRHGHVSWERVVSGIGIGNLYSFLAERAETEHRPAVAAALNGAGDLAAAVAAAADDGCPVCIETLELFIQLYGREVGNAALKLMALGGVYLGGGIAPKQLARLRGPAFLDAFCDKGRMRPLMQRMPVKVILQPRLPLYGAALCLAAGADGPGGR